MALLVAGLRAGTGAKPMSKTTDELYAYLERKRDRQRDHGENLERCLRDENYDQANIHREKANELDGMCAAIEHCIQIVRANEPKKENPNIIKEPYNPDRWPLYNAKKTCEHVIELQWSGYKCTKCDGWYCA